MTGIPVLTMSGDPSQPLWPIAEAGYGVFERKKGSIASILPHGPDLRIEGFSYDVSYETGHDSGIFERDVYQVGGNNE